MTGIRRVQERRINQFLRAWQEYREERDEYFDRLEKDRREQAEKRKGKADMMRELLSLGADLNPIFDPMDILEARSSTHFPNPYAYVSHKPVRMSPEDVQNFIHAFTDAVVWVVGVVQENEQGLPEEVVQRKVELLHGDQDKCNHVWLLQYPPESDYEVEALRRLQPGGKG